CIYVTLLHALFCDKLTLALRIKAYQADPLIQFSAIVAGFISTTHAIAKFCNRLVYVVGQNRENYPCK
ncbi:MAG: hypothetical protein KJZ66_12790, partial [Candidatus Kuenenia stuttgartiensis]|nr:hypothetical protein [Candidatus Kuenenia stuttgartiensis]